MSEFNGPKILDDFNTLQRTYDVVNDDGISFGPTQGSKGGRINAGRKSHCTFRNLSKQNIAIRLSYHRVAKSEAKLKQMYETLTLKMDAFLQLAIVVVSDAHGRITEANKGFLQVSGYKMEELLNEIHCADPRSIFNMHVHPTEFFESINETLKNRKVWQGEICSRSKSGHPFWLLKTIVPIVNGNKQIESLFSFSHDITFLKRWETEILEAKKDAEEASKSKVDFLSVMSHEIRTPLNSVIGLSNLLLKRAPREDQIEIIKTLKNSGDYLLRLANDILDFQKITLSKVELENVQFNLFEFLGQLNSLFNPLATEKGLDFFIVVAPDLPMNAIGDVTRLNQILNNLISNAIKFTHKGVVCMNVNLKVPKSRKPLIQFEVRDTGIGIAADKITTIFTPFLQTERDINRKFGGTGLGLSIVRSLSELMKGKLTVASTLGKGSTFTVELPFGLPEYYMSRKPAKEEKADVLSNLKGLTVLYVEDVESNRFLIENVLEDHDINCIGVSNGKLALRLTASQHFDIILMDIQLPVMDGYKVTRAIRNQPGGKNRSTPIIAFTAELYSGELKKRITDHGIHAIIHKPLQVETLLENISTVLRKVKRQVPLVSFDFYERALNHDQAKIRKFILMIRNDFQELTSILLTRSKNRTKGLHEKIHKIRPIANNLKCFSLTDLLDHFPSACNSAERAGTVTDDLKGILDEIDACFDRYLSGPPGPDNKSFP